MTVTPKFDGYTYDHPNGKKGVYASNFVCYNVDPLTFSYLVVCSRCGKMGQ